MVTYLVLMVAEKDYFAEDYETPTRFMAFDCATITGYCVIEGGVRLASGTFTSAKKTGEGNGALFLRFNGHVRDLVKEFNPDVLICEAAHMRGAGATQIGIGLQTRIMENAVRYGAEYISVHTGELKKAMGGHGKASKDEMIEAAKKLSGIIPKDDNEADAICLAYYGDKNWRK